MDRYLQQTCIHIVRILYSTVYNVCTVHCTLNAHYAQEKQKDFYRFYWLRCLKDENSKLRMANEHKRDKGYYKEWRQVKIGKESCMLDNIVT